MGPSALDVRAGRDTEPPATGHEGSAPLYLTGRLVVSAWFLSILLHVVCLGLMFFVVFPYVPTEPKDLAVPRIELIGDPEATSFVPSQAPDLSTQAKPVDPLETRFAPEELVPLSELTTSQKPELTILGIGAGGGDFSQYGLSAGPGLGTEFFGLGGSARGVRRVVYVVDRSGSMLDTFGYVRKELIRSISALRRTQKFHVIFFNAGRPLENPPRQLVSAIQEQKNRFFQFLESVYPEGSTHPEQAMRRALAVEPELIYFLTDGEFDPSLIEKLEDWNRDRQVKIFTIAYFDRTGARLLEEIARRHGGEFKFVSENDLP